MAWSSPSPARARSSWASQTGGYGWPSSDLRHGRIARYQGSFSPVSAPTIERVKFLRYGEARGDYDQVVGTLNASDPHGK